MENKNIKTLLKDYDRIVRKHGDPAEKMMQAIILGDSRLQKQLAVRMQLRQVIGHAVRMGQYRRAEKLLFVLQQMEKHDHVAEDQLKNRVGQKMCAG